MNATAKIGSLLAAKGGGVWSVEPAAMVFDAIHEMAEKGVGALLVMSEGRLLGIISERDYTRKVILKGHSSKDMRVDEIMTSDVVTATAEETVEGAMRLMTERRIRHLPVLAGGQDLVNIETIKVDLVAPAPFSGTVVAVNPALTDRPELINQAPYGAGWLVELRPATWPVPGLLDAPAYLAVVTRQAQAEAGQ